MDLRSLLGVATGDDLAVARQAVRQITERGVHPGRDLEAALVELLGQGCA